MPSVIDVTPPTTEARRTVRHRLPRRHPWRDAIALASRRNSASAGESGIAFCNDVELRLELRRVRGVGLRLGELCLQRLELRLFDLGVRCTFAAFAASA